MGSCGAKPTSALRCRPVLRSTATAATAAGNMLNCTTSASFRCCHLKAPATSSSSSSLSSTQSPPDIVRHWIIKPEFSLPILPPPQERFTIVSYNILGDKNATKHSNMYDNVPSAYMKWAHRKTVICEELTGWNPDLICLQEVDKYLDFSSNMEKAGFQGSYKRRSGDTVDGCAMFWKADKFRLLDTETIEYKQYGLRDNVAQLSVFEMIEAQSRRVVVGNIHVVFRPSRGEVKVAQIRLLSLKAQILSEKWGNAPIVLAGDYNCTPQSAIYEFLSASELNIMLHERRDLSGQRDCHPTNVLGVKKGRGSLLELMGRCLKYSWTDEDVRKATGSSECQIATHPLKLKSAYATLKGSSRTRGSTGEPLATSFHLKFLGTVDYIWYTNGLVPTRVLDTVPIDILETTGGLPCKKLGSDHLALVSEFAFVESSNTYARCLDSSSLVEEEDSCASLS